MTTRYGAWRKLLTRREDPEVETSQARVIGQVQAEMPVLDAEIVKPAAVLDPEPCQEER